MKTYKLIAHKISTKYLWKKKNLTIYKLCPYNNLKVSELYLPTSRNIFMESRNQLFNLKLTDFMKVIISCIIDHNNNLQSMFMSLKNKFKFWKCYDMAYPLVQIIN